MHYLIALGANLASRVGAPADTLEHALWLLLGRDYRLLGRSAFYKSAAFPLGSGPDFINAAIAVEAAIPPERVLADLLAIEAALGRQRSQRWAPRVIDLDLIAAEDTILPDRTSWAEWHALPAERQQTAVPDQLILPHPRLQDRPFVLHPLAEIAPAWRHPVLGATVRALIAQLPDGAAAGLTRLEPA